MRAIISFSIIFLMICFFEFNYSKAQELSPKELIINGCFSDGNVDFFSDYIYTTTDQIRYEGYYSVANNAFELYYKFDSCGAHTSKDGLFLIANGNDKEEEPLPAIWYQIIEDIEPFADYQFSIWTQNLVDRSPAILAVIFNNDTMPLIYLSQQTCDWRNSIFNWNSGDATQAEIRIINTRLDYNGNDLGIDDISFRQFCRLEVRSPRRISLCRGDSIPLIVEVINGFNPLTYEWTQSEFLSSLSNASPLAFPEETTTFYYKIIDNSECFVYDSIIVDVFPKPEAYILVSPDDTLCPCQTVELTAALGIEYLWSNGETTKIILLEQAGDYWVDITNEFGCTSRAYTTINQFDVNAVFLIDTISSKVGETVRLPLSLSSQQYREKCGFSYFRMQIRFNKTVLYPISPTPFGFSDGNFQIIELEGNNYDSLLFELQFIATLGNSRCTEIIIDFFEFDCLDIPILTNNGLFCIDDICDEPVDRLFDAIAGGSIINNFPNPTDLKTTINLNIQEAEHNELLLYDFRGRKLKLIEEFNKQGIYEIELNTSSMPIGLYFLVLKTPTSYYSKILSVVR